jgi:ABC-type transport system involved in cytochrome c biogenesis permease component
MKNTNIVLASLMLLVSGTAFATVTEDVKKNAVVNINVLPVSAPVLDIVTPSVVNSTEIERTPEQKASIVELDLMSIAVAKK